MNKEIEIGMLKSVISLFFICSFIFLKMDEYLKHTYDSNDYPYVGFFIFLFTFIGIHIYQFIIGTLQISSKLILTFSTIIFSFILMMIPFYNPYDFFLNLFMLSPLIILSVYLFGRHVKKLNRENHSIPDIIYNQFMIMINSGFFRALIVCGFCLLLNLKGNTISFLVMSAFSYFLILFIISFIYKFHITRNLFLDTLSAIFFGGLIFLGSAVNEENVQTCAIVCCLVYVLFNVFNVIKLFKYIVDPVKFFEKANSYSEVATKIFSSKYAQKNLDYFYFFNTLQIRDVFIQYNSFFHCVDAIFNKEYVILYSKSEYMMHPEDYYKLFHIDYKEIMPSTIIEFTNLIEKKLDQQNNIDKYTFENFYKIKAYLSENSMSYNQLKNDDIKVIEMFNY